MTQDIKRRFIAGAVCPECQAVDRIVVETHRFDETRPGRRLCVSCGFEDRQPVAGSQGDVPVEWPASRLEHDRRVEVSPAPVRLLSSPAAKAPAAKAPAAKMPVVKEGENDSRNEEN